MSKIPKYGIHKGTGQARVTINGETIYLGVHGTPASRQKYDRLVTEYLANDRQLPANHKTVTELVALYWAHCKRYYIKNGRPTLEQAGRSLGWKLPRWR